MMVANNSKWWRMRRAEPQIAANSGGQCGRQRQLAANGSDGWW